MRSGNHPQAAIIQGGIVNSDPSAAQAAIASGDVKFVLMPGLPWFTCRFREKHGLHAFHTAVPVPFSEMRPYNLR